jgi:hypothetical protein
MHLQLVSILVGVALIIGAGSPLPFGRSLVAPAPLLGGVPDEPSNERPRILGTVASKNNHPVPAPAYEGAMVQSVFSPHLLTIDAAVLVSVSGTALCSATLVPVPLRC